MQLLRYPQGYSDEKQIKQKQLHQDLTENERSSLSGDLKQAAAIPASLRRNTRGYAVHDVDHLSAI